MKPGRFYRHEKQIDVDMFVLSIRNGIAKVGWVLRHNHNHLLEYDYLPIEKLKEFKEIE